MKAIITKSITITNEKGAAVSFPASTVSAPFVELPPKLFSKLKALGIAFPYAEERSFRQIRTPAAEPVGPIFDKKGRKK